jgi:hypothetical protein
MLLLLVVGSGLSLRIPRPAPRVRFLFGADRIGVRYDWRKGVSVDERDARAEVANRARELM